MKGVSILLRIAICDDDKYICGKLEELIAEFAIVSIVKVDVESFYRGEDLIHFIQHNHPFDLIFLDIELGTTTGVEVGSKIRNELNDHISKIVFVSSTTGYDRQLFTVQPFGFLEKPVNSNELIRYLKLAIQVLRLENQYFTYKVGTEFKKVTLNDIVYFESSLRKIKIVTLTSVDFFHSTFSEITQKLPHTFVSPHGSFVVNYAHIKRISKDKIYMTDGTVIAISQRNMKHLRNLQIQMTKEKMDASL